MLSERLDDRVGIETIESDCDGTSIELPDQALFLIGFYAGTTGIIESAKELPPVFFKALVGGGGIG